MESTDNQKTAADGDLQATCAALQSQVNLLLAALIVVSLVLAGYFYTQQKYVGQDLDASRPAATQIIQAFQQQDVPRIDAFVSKLAEYGKTHPDFAPIIEKYKVSIKAPAPATAPKP